MAITSDKVKEVLLQAMEVNKVSKKDVARILGINYNTFLLHFGEGVPTGYELLGMCQLFSLTEDNFKNEPISPVSYIAIFREQDINHINKMVLKIETLMKKPSSPIRFKKELAEKLQMDYRKLVNKLNSNTLKADELLNIIELLDGKISMFVPINNSNDKLIKNGLYMESESKRDFQTIYVDSRENIGVKDMYKYVNGGVVVDSLKLNGVELYFPYGIFIDYFNSVNIGINSMKVAISDMEKERNNYTEKLKDFDMDMDKRLNFEGMVNLLQNEIIKLKNSVAILEMVSPIIHEV